MIKSRFLNFLIVLIVISMGSAEIKPRDVSEGTCVTPVPKPVKFEIIWAVEFGTKAKYVPMASELYYTYTTKFTRGKPLQSFEEMDKMCMFIQTTGFASDVSTFGVKKSIECELKDIGSLLCGTPELMNDESLTEEQRNATLIVATWTDHKDYLVTVNCFPSGRKAWNVVSSRKTVDDNIKHTILNHITQFGFDPKKAREAKYDSCKN